LTGWGPVEPPAPVEGLADVDDAVRELGRLGPVLRWLAATQGAWPPRRPHSLDVVVCAPAPEGSLATGRARADAAADAGDDLLVVGSTGEPAPGLVVVAALLGLEPVRVVGTAGGGGWAARMVAVRDGLRVTGPHLGDPAALLAAIGDGALAELTGLLAQASVRRTAVLLDGSPLVAGAALLAERLAPGAAAWWLAGQTPPSPGVAAALAELHLVPLLDLRLSRPEGAALVARLLADAVGLLAGPADA